jgi:uncharacterized protein YbbC (DUF1343 family)
MKQLLLLLCISSCTCTIHTYQLGIETMPTELESLKHSPSALVANQSSVDQQKNRTLDILLENGFNVVNIFAPEHGFCGTTHAADIVHNGMDHTSGIPIISIYHGEHNPTPSPHLLDHVETVFFDLQDCGMRHYTYISTLYHLLTLCAQTNKRIVVFDRPNPLGPVMEGPLVERALISFVAIVPIPLRHGMTIGEIALYMNAHHLHHTAPLTVVPMKHYRRDIVMPQLHTPLSPNIPDIDSCYGYTFLELLSKIEPFFTGRDTHMPFKMIAYDSRNHWNIVSRLTNDKGLGLALAPVLEAQGIQCTLCRYNRSNCVHVTVKDINHFSAYNTLIQVLDFCTSHDMYMQPTTHFDEHCGTVATHHYLRGTITRHQLAQQINTALDTFFQHAYSCFLYQPHPRITYLDSQNYSAPFFQDKKINTQEDLRALQPLIHISSMSNSNNIDNNLFMLDCVYDSKVPNPQSI